MGNDVSPEKRNLQIHSPLYNDPSYQQQKLNSKQL